MNINNINNVNKPIVPKRPVDREQTVPAAKAGQTEITSESEETQEVTQVPVNEETEAATLNKDTFSISDDPRLVEELTTIVENMEESPREEAVTRARERVEGGYYNTREFMSGLAVNLVNNERLID